MYNDMQQYTYNIHTIHNDIQLKNKEYIRVRNIHNWWCTSTRK